MTEKQKRTGQGSEAVSPPIRDKNFAPPAGLPHNTGANPISELLDNSVDANLGGMPFFRPESVFESLRTAEFDFRTAVAELLDNSAEAGARDIWLFIKTAKKAFKTRSLEVIDEVAVVDNGEGMGIESLAKCLVLGETLRPPRRTGKGIGRFGVGMTFGGISIARRIEVYSRTNGSEEFNHVYLDLNEIKDRKMSSIPVPEPKSPPAEYLALLNDSAGTVIILKDCDRVQQDPVDPQKGVSANEQIKDLPNFVGRTYRKFIGGGMRFWLKQGDAPILPIFLHDPLYMMGPTRFEAEGKTEEKAKLRGEPEEIELDIPGEPGKKATITITMSILPASWRKYQGAGGSDHARQRKIDENEGISILRANREVLYGPVEYILGKRGQAGFLEIDRWWGCEISFPPELDDYFHVRFIKRGAEPIPSLRDKIRQKIHNYVETLRGQIRGGFEKAVAEAEKERGVFEAAERAMAEADKVMPRGTRGASVTPEETEKILDRVVEESISDPDVSKEEKKQRIVSKPYSIVSVDFPQNFFFETVHVPGKIVVKLNTNHLFYKKVFEPLCGSVETMDEDSDVMMGADTPEKRLARHAMMLILLSYAKSESMFEEHDALFMNLRSNWGTALATVVEKFDKE